jgi:hypothetical protein
MTLQQIPSEFPYTYMRKNSFSFFISAVFVGSQYFYSYPVPGDEVFLEEGLRRHIERDNGGEVGENRVHGVSRLLPRNPQILLQRPHNRGEDRLRGLVRVHGNTRTCKRTEIRKLEAEKSSRAPARGPRTLR